MTDKIVVYNTCPTRESAYKMAGHLVDQRLAACVTVVPGVQSFYRWEGKIEQAEEWMLVIKTSRPVLDKLRQEIERIHEYQVPEVIALPILDGTANYLAWMEDSLPPAE